VAGSDTLIGRSAFGVQVWADSDRAGCSTMVLGESNLDERIGHLDGVGISHDDLQDATSSRVLPMRDPDGNQIVFTGALPGGQLTTPNQPGCPLVAG